MDDGYDGGEGGQVGPSSIASPPASRANTWDARGFQDFPAPGYAA
jgi:hypothetical protein